MAMSVAAHTSASRVWSVGHENALNRSSAQERSLAEAARSRPLTQTSVRRDLIGMWCRIGGFTPDLRLGPPRTAKKLVRATQSCRSRSPALRVLPDRIQANTAFAYT